MFNRLDRYLFLTFLKTFLFMVGLMVVVIVVIDVAERLDDFLKNNVPFSEAFSRYYLNTIPWFINLLSPICVFLSAIFFTARLTQNSEFIAMLSGGISFYRLLVPYLVAATLLTGISFWLNNYLVPTSMARKMDFEYQYFEHGEGSVRLIHKKLGPNRFAHIQRYDSREQRAYNVLLEQYDTTGGLQSTFWASMVVVDDSAHTWHCERVKLMDYRPDGSVRIRNLPRMDTAVGLRHEDLFQRKFFAESMPLAELEEFIELERERGSDMLTPLILERHSRAALPFASFVMTIIAYALSTKKRRGGIALQLGLGFIICFVYVFCISVSRSALGDVLEPWLAVWLPNFIFMAFGLVLLRVVPK
jgi:lipopolysaccharide export system permease protein